MVHDKQRFEYLEHTLRRCRQHGKVGLMKDFEVLFLSRKEASTQVTALLQLGIDRMKMRNMQDIL